MDPIAVRVLDPTGQPSAQLVDPFRPVQELLDVLVHRLDLPQGPHYELVRESTGAPLAGHRALYDADVRAGESLRLRPVRDAELDAFLEKLYEDAVERIAAGLIEEARALLEALYRLAPQYPDPQGLWRKIAMKGGAPASGSASSGTPPSAPARPTLGGAPPRSAAPRVPRPTASAPRTGSTAGSTAGCFVVLVFGLGLVAVFMWFNGAFDGLGLARPSGNTSPGIPQRPGEPTLGTGDVQVTLRWDTAADLDLHVTDPSGQTVSYGNPAVPSGGQLDVDAHAGCGTEAPVENVFWPTGGAPSGPYTVRINYYGACGAGPSGYELTVQVDGRVVEQREGSLGSPGEEASVSFTR